MCKTRYACATSQQLKNNLLELTYASQSVFFLSPPTNFQWSKPPVPPDHVSDYLIYMCSFALIDVIYRLSIYTVFTLGMDIEN